MARKHVLVVDDEQEVTSFFTYFLKQKNCDVTAANSGREVDRLLAERHAGFDAALIDLKLPDANGLDLLTRIKSAYPSCGVLIMTGYSTIKSAVTAIQRGARDYLEKPFDDLDSLEGVIDSVLDEPLKLADELSREAAHYGIVYAPGGPMEKLISVARKLAKKAINVLIEGETGTGKELLARYLHGSSLRAQYPFVALNCGAVPETLLESELFGYERGAFTGALKPRKGFFELANNGTLFLDEIGEAPPSIQVKLLRALETGEYMKVGGEHVAKANIRFLSATNRALEQEVTAKRFRQDLLYRLEGVKLTIPPLRERAGDIPLIAHSYLEKRFGSSCRIDPAALALLQSYEWPGNVRQLINVLNQAIAIHECEVLRPEHLPPQIASQTPAAGGSAAEAKAEAAAVCDRIDRECERFVEAIIGNMGPVEEFDFDYAVKRVKLLEAEVGRKAIEQGLAKTKGDRQLLSETWNISKRTIRYFLNEKA
ncbi:sigma-54-dependent transcriptional regulator [Brevibacillus sp. B_LB10_24]|uniref:sigma-54-dependent transcriptional regulator n=1 Tax=Brevibacillus sp. B_LB10_24 TaxID=3380645 RepID=UPI0038B97CE4